MASIMTAVGEWEGQVGDVWAQEWQRTDRSFSELTVQLAQAIADIAPETGTAIDIGCGAAETAIGLARANPAIKVTGIDLSSGLLDVARSRVEGLTNINFVLGDAVSEAASRKPVNLYISRHGVMFFDDPVAAFTSFRQAASSEARIVFSCFRDWSLNAFAHDIGELTGAAAPTDAAGPFAFASKDRVESILAASGWRDVEATHVDFDYIAGQGDDPVEDAISFMRRIGPAARAIRLANEEERPVIIDGLRQICESRRQDKTVLFPAAAWIWTARA